jgi:histidinol-phosphatase (PHP family)
MILPNSDSHIHTRYSADADQDVTFEDYIKRAKELGLSELAFTDHVDIDAVHPLFHKQIDYDVYLKDFRQVQTNTDFPIRLGVEIGYQSHVVEETNAFLDRYPFEFVILSIHYLEKKDLYTQEYFEGKTKEEAYQIYFETLLDAVQTMDKFDVVGHLDYIPRYSPYEDYEYEEYKEIIDQILQTVIAKGKGIEINASGFKTEGRMYPKVEVIKRYLELGGTNITLGSDAHRISELGRNFDEIRNELQSILEE